MASSMEQTTASAARLARGLGWLSVGLGVAHLAAPRGLARVIGLRTTPRNQKVMRAIGVRELTAGIGILAQPRAAGWLWARVGYDLSDLAILGSILASRRAERGRVAAATAALLGVAALDTLAARRLGGREGAMNAHPRKARTPRVSQAITVNRPPEEVYRFWRNFENIPRFASHVESVRVLDERRSHWVAKSPTGAQIAWDAKITEDRPGELVAWRSIDGAEVRTSGTVRFTRAPGGRGTEVHLEMRYDHSSGVLGAAFGRLFGAGLRHLAASDLHHFKQILETGDIVRSDASVHRGPHAAQPPEERERPRRAPLVASTGLQGEAR